MNLRRHVGKIKNTDRRCVVAFMQIPGREDHALVVDTDALPERFHDHLMELLESHEGQHEPTLANLMSRRVMPETGVDMLNTLFRFGYLQPIHIDNMLMCPRPNETYTLRSILEAMGKKIPLSSPAFPEPQPIPHGYVDQTKPAEPEPAPVQFLQETSSPVPQTHDFGNPEEVKFNVYDHNLKVETSEHQEAIARNLLIQAQMMEDDAKRTREQAYRLAPSLKASSPSTKKQTVETPLIDEPVAKVLDQLKVTTPAAEKKPRSRTKSTPKVKASAQK